MHPHIACYNTFGSFIFFSLRAPPKIPYRRIVAFLDQAFGGHAAGRRDDMLVEVDLTSIVAELEVGGGAGVDHHGRGGGVGASFGSQDPYGMVCLSLCWFLWPFSCCFCSCSACCYLVSLQVVW